MATLWPLACDDYIVKLPDLGDLIGFMIGNSNPICGNPHNSVKLPTEANGSLRLSDPMKMKSLCGV
ncbi:Uncharacterised protein [BD1-7 clade bacterium]|uniref:Uncharacterized protein n=1 Tax=BD1-7 clade bacterium TaxID=2029982 RepID=A0A5S9P842_9GAMM|nr:Uncharacterised protein [BD1-7 clade bacterium]CAA0099608.1 Uncharacterised protein [BD1-7 clade bacterium]